MIKVLTLVRRHPDLTRAAFFDYWLNHHAKLVMSTPDFWRHVRKYKQNHCLPGMALFGAEAAAETYDGCAELWFDSVEALGAAVNEPAYLAIIRPDELKCFDDLSNAPVLITEEHVLA